VEDHDVGHRSSETRADACRYSEILDYHNVDAPAAGMENGLAAATVAA
jgi:hypothetical protein